MYMPGLERVLDLDYVLGSIKRLKEKVQHTSDDLQTDIDESTAAPAYRSVSANDSLRPAIDKILVFDATAANFQFTLTTPVAAEGEAVRFTGKFIATNGNSVELIPEDGQIDGQASLIVSGAMDRFDFGWTGSNWYTL